MGVGEIIVRVTNKLLSKARKQNTNWIGVHGKTEFRTKNFIFETIRGKNFTAVEYIALTLISICSCMSSFTQSFTCCFTQDWPLIHILSEHYR